MTKVGGREEVRGTGDPPDWPGKSCAKQSDGVVWGAMVCSPRGINCNPELAKLAKVQKGLRGQKFSERGGGWKATKGSVRVVANRPSFRLESGPWNLISFLFITCHASSVVLETNIYNIIYEARIEENKDIEPSQSQFK